MAMERKRECVLVCVYVRVCELCMRNRLKGEVSYKDAWADE